MNALALTAMFCGFGAAIAGVIWLLVLVVLTVRRSIWGHPASHIGRDL